MTEPEVAGSDPTGIQTRAAKDGDNLPIGWLRREEIWGVYPGEVIQ